MPKIAVIGSLVVDMAMRIRRVPKRGENLAGNTFRMGAGGKGANAAAAIVRLGGLALVVGCVGDDELGHFEVAAIAAEGVDTAGITKLRGEPTAVAFVMVDPTGENTILVANRTNELLSARAVEEVLCPHWGELDALLLNFEVSEEAVEAVVRAGRHHGLPVVVDAGPVRSFSPETWKQATVLSPNLHEAAALLQLDPTTLQDDQRAKQAAQALLTMGPEAIVLKRGAQGALLLRHNEELSLPGYPVSTVDTTGAGDAFTAGLTLAIAEGKTLKDAVRFGNAAGAMATTRFGTLEAMPRRADVDRLLQT